jgi:VWFA-related protein
MPFLARLAAPGLLAAAVSAAAQEPPAPPSPPPTFGGDVEVVRVDVVVTDKSGRPVPGLTKADFTLLDEGKPRSIDTFESVELPLPPPSSGAGARPRVATNEVPPGTDQARSYVVLFDNLNLTPITAPRAKAAVAAFLDRGARDGDRVTLIATGGGAWWGTRMPAGRADLLEILKGLDGRRIKTDMRDAITDYEAMRIYLYSDSQVAGRVARRFETYGVTSRVESEQERERRETYMPGVIDPYVERRASEEYLKVRTRNRIVFQTFDRALKPLLATRERKTVLLVSDGFVFDPQEDGFKRVSETARRGNAVLYFLDARGLEGQSIYGAQFGYLPGAAPELGAVLADNSMDAEGAEALALETGGFAVRNTNDLTGGVERIAQEARSYYLLGYSPEVPRDGKFRKLEVKVRGRGLSVRSRRGYYAPSDAPATAEAPGRGGKDTEFQQALDATAYEDDIGMRMTAYVLADGGPGLVRVLVVAEVDVSKVTFQPGADGQSVGSVDLLLVTARRETGEFSRYDQKVDLARKPGAPAGPSWYSVQREFELSPGGYQTKLVVRDPVTRKLGSVAYEFEIPAAEGLRVSTPVLTDTLQQSAEGIGPVPVARRAFWSGWPLYCRFDVFGAAKDDRGQPRVSAGHLLRRADGTVIGRSEPSAIMATSLGAVARLMQVPLNVDPGDYELVLTVRDELAGQSRELVEPFSVVERRASQ